MSERPTRTQQKLLEFVDKFNNENPYSPTYREIKAALGYKSVSTVAVHVNNLVDRGLLRKVDNHARTLEVVHASSVESATVTREDHINWLRREVARFAIDSAEAEVLRKALSVLAGAQESADASNAAPDERPSADKES